MSRQPNDAIRDLAIEIVNIFINLLREDEIRDAFAEVHERLKNGVERINHNSIGHNISENR